MIRPDYPSDLIHDAKELASSIMELHVLSFRMGNDTVGPQDYARCQGILARAAALEAEIESYELVPRGTAQPA